MVIRPRNRTRLVAAVLLSMTAFVRAGFAQQAPPVPLANLQFDIVGVRLVVDPPALTVPKNIATQINTSLVTPPGLGDEIRDAIATLTDGAQVEGELRGPSLAPTRIAVAAGQPIPIPPLAIAGDYFLDGIRLVRNGETILDATAADGRPATTIPIRVINEVLVASVTSRPLALDDIRSKGIVIDEKNFSAVNFQVAFNIDGTSFTIDAPAVLPTPELLQTRPDRTELIRQITGLNRSLAATQTTLPPQFDRPGLNFSIAALPFFPVMQQDGGDPPLDTPPITGLIVIPGNVAFLNQFFSALLLVANVAPDGTPLVLRDVTGTITLPTGLDRVAGSYDAPGDDPLRLARIDGVGIQPIVGIAQRGPDGKLGTADDIFLIPPQKQGEGEFLIEGLKEGSHSFDIAINATLVGLPSGPVALEGQAAGAVFVRNPTFAVTLAHPRTVRSGESYSIYATVTNTSTTAANLVSVNLDPASITGAQLLTDQSVTFTSIPPGESAVAKFSLKAQLTGDVTFASFTGDAALGGGIRLETGVDERGVALAANAIVLPQSADLLPASLVAAAQRVLGQAFSVATAPAEALPQGVLFVKRQTVIDRGVELAEAGERIKFGEPLARVAQDLLLDWLGNVTLDAGFDQILRATDAGAALVAEFAAILGPESANAGALEYQRQFAQSTVTRSGHLSAIASGPSGSAAPLVRVIRATGETIGFDAGEDGGSTLPSAALLVAAGTPHDTRFALVAHPEPDRYAIELLAPAAGLYDLGVVVPLPTLGQLRQLRFSAVALDAGGTARVEVDLTGASTIALSIDRNGDGVPDSTRTPDTADIAAGPPQLVAVRQLESSSRDATAALVDPAAYGLLVGALFDRPVTKDSSESKTNYVIESNTIIGAQLQHSGRLVYLYLQKPIGGLTPRSLTASNIVDAGGLSLGTATQPIATILSDGAHVFGQVRDAGGSGVGGGILKLTVTAGPTSFDVSSFNTDLNGGFDFDFVPRLGDVFTLTAQHPVTHDLTSISARIRGAGEQLLINPTFLGRGTVRGRVIGPDGVAAVPNIPVALIPGSVLGTRGFQGRTNAIGEFTFVDVPAGVFTLTAADGTGGFGQATGLVAHGGDVVAQDLRLVSQPDEGGHLVGRVFLSNGTTPAAGFTVYIGQYSRDSATMAAVDQTTTDADGAFAFAQTLPPNGYDVVAIDPASRQLGTARTSIAARTTSSVSIVLESTGAVEGVVFNGRGERVAGAVVAGGVALVTADANGFFRIEGVPAGSRTIEAGDPITKRRGTAVVTVLPGQTVGASITLESRATIVGRVLDANGNPVPGASVRIPAVDGYTFVIANNQGVFTFPDLTLGDYLIQAPGPSKESLVSFMEANGIDPRSAFTSGDGPDGPSAPVTSASDKNAILAAYQQAVQTFFSVNTAAIDGLPMADIGGFGWNKVALFQDAASVVADIKFLPQGSVGGRTVDSAARPTGAVVRVSALKVSSTGFPDFGEIKRVNTDPATGAFAFGGIARFDLATFQTANVRGGDFTLEAANPFSPAHPQFRGQLSTTTPNLTDVVLQFPAATDTNGTISGRVFLPDGVTPAPAGTQVRISFGDLTVTTDADGKFRSVLPIPAGMYTVTAQTVSGLRGQTAALVPPGGNVDVSMRVLGLGAIAVTVLRTNGAAVPNALVSLVRADFPFDRAEGTTDASGIVRFVNITEGPFGVTAQEAVTGLSGRSNGTILRDAQGALTTVITASGTMTGTFVTADGAHPIAFAQITLATGGVQAYAATDAAGRFVLTAVPIGAFTVEGFDPLTNRRGRATGALQVEGQSVDVTILQLPRGTVAGFVLNADGVGSVPAARVKLHGSSFVQTELQATAFADGSFRFDGVPAGGFTLEAVDPVSGFGGTATGTITFEGQTVDANITLAPFGSIRATVLDVNGQPASNASIAIEGRQAAADANGQFTFENLALGTYHVVARSLAEPNNGGTATAKIETANQVVDVNVPLRGVGSVTVTVVPASGSGVVASAEVTLTASGNATGAPGPLSATVTGFTSAAGTVTFPNVPVGAFTVRAEAAALAGIASGSVGASGSSTSVQVQLGASGTVAGRILLPDGATPAANAFVTLRFQSQSSLQSGVVQVTTSISGDFEFRGIPLGSFTLSAIEVTSNGVRSGAGSIATDGQRVDLGALTLDNAAPRVVSVSPIDGSGNVNARGPIVVTFSEPMAAGSFSASGPSTNVSLTESAAPVPITLEFSADGRSVTVRPTRDLVSSALETLAIKGAPDGPKDLADLVLLDPFVSTFTVRDSIPPTVVSISPAADARQIAPDAVVRITFSEPVAAAALTLTDSGGHPIAGTAALAVGNTVAIFAPANFLQANETYTVRATGVADVAGNPLVGGAFTSSFQTVDTIAPTIAALQVVGAARAGANALVRATVTASDVQRVDFTLGTATTQSVPHSPFEASFLLPANSPSVVVTAVAFDLVGNRSNPFTITVPIQPNAPPTVTLRNLATSNVVSQSQSIDFEVHATDDDQLAQVFFTAVGAVSASVVRSASGQTDSTQTFTLTVPASAPSNSTITVQAAATDAAGGQSQPATLTLTVRDGVRPTVTVLGPVNNAIVVSGQTLDVVADTSDDVALASLALVCNPTLAGCETRQLTGAASRQTFSVALPATLQAPQTVSLSLVATDAAGNTTTAGRTAQIADTVKPTISALVSVSGSTHVNAGDVATLRASVVDNVGVTSLAFTVDGAFTSTGTVPVTPAVANGTATLTIQIPATAPNAGAVTVHVRARDAANNTSDETTLALTIGDSEPPVLTVLEPANGFSVAPGGTVTVRAHATDDVGVRRFTLGVTGAFTAADARDITPASTPADATFVVAVPATAPAGSATVHVEAVDASGATSLAVERTIAVSDVAAPQVHVDSPLANAALDPRSPIPVAVTATDAVGVTAISLTTSGTVSATETRTVSPAATSRVETFSINVTPIPASGGSLTFAATARDAAGNVGTAATVTVHLSDVVAPDVASIDPANGATGVDRQASIVVRFTEPMDRATLTSAALELRQGTTVVPAAIAIGGDDDVVTVTPATRPLAANTLFTVTVSPLATDRAGNALAASRTFTFRTASLDTTSPRISTIDPADGAADVSLASPVTVTFSEAVDPSTVTAQSFSVRAGSDALAGTFSFLSANSVVRFTPADPLPPDTAIVTSLTSAIADPFGNALVAADGSALSTPATFTFATGRFSLTSPAGSEVVENSSLLLEARASAALGVASVVFTVNDQAQPAVSGPPFTRAFAVGSAASTPTLTIVASGRDSSGVEVARDEKSFAVVVGLRVSPTLTGVPLGGSGTLRFSLSSALTTPLPIALAAGDPAIVTFPVNTVVLPAGETSVEASIAGAATGATAVIASSSHGQAVSIVAVSPVQPGQTLAPFAVPTGVSLVNPPAAGMVVAQAGSTRTVRVALLSAPATADTPVTVVSTNTAVATATASSIAAGQQTTDLQITAIADGIATIVLRIGNDVRGFTVFVGAPPAGSTPLLLASAVGVSISNPPNAGHVITAAGRHFTVAVAILNAPAPADTPVSVTTSNPSVATASGGTIAAGQTTATITIDAVADGVVTLIVNAGGESRSLTIFVGAPPAGSTPLLLASPIGVGIAALPSLGRTFAQLGVTRTLSLRLFNAPVASDTPVTVTTSDPTVATTSGSVVIPAGGQVANVTIVTGAGGVATLTIEAAGVRRELTISVGTDPAPGSTPPVVAAPVGVTVMPNPSIGRVFGQPGAASSATLGIPVLSAPAATPTHVTITSGNTAVATVGGGATTAIDIAAGEQVLQLPVAVTGTEGAALVTIEFNGQRRELLIIVGNPPASEIPAVTAPVVGVRIG